MQARLYVGQTVLLGPQYYVGVVWTELQEFLMTCIMCTDGMMIPLITVYGHHYWQRLWGIWIHDLNCGLEQGTRYGSGHCLKFHLPQETAISECNSAQPIN